METELFYLYCVCQSEVSTIPLHQIMKIVCGGNISYNLRLAVGSVEEKLSISHF
jgi:hypothetical protein